MRSCGSPECTSLPCSLGLALGCDAALGARQSGESADLVGLFHSRQSFKTASPDLLPAFAPTYRKTEEEWAERVRAYLKAELKKAEVGYVELAKRLKKHGFKDETEASITNKLKRGTFTASFLLASLAALESEGMKLEDV